MSFPSDRDTDSSPFRRTDRRREQMTDQFIQGKVLVASRNDTLLRDGVQLTASIIYSRGAPAHISIKHYDVQAWDETFDVIEGDFRTLDDAVEWLNRHYGLGWSDLHVSGTE